MTDSPAPSCPRCHDRRHVWMDDGVCYFQRPCPQCQPANEET